MPKYSTSGPEASPAVTDTTRDPRAESTEWPESLASMDPRDLTPELAAALIDAQPGVRDHVLRALHRLRGNGFVQEVVRRLGETSDPAIAGRTITGASR